MKQERSFIAVVEKGADNYSAYVPDLPGCVATGRTMTAVKKNIHGAIAMHIEGLQEDGLPIPKPSTQTLLVTV